MLTIDLELLFLFLVFAAIILFVYINRKPRIYYSGKYEALLRQLGIKLGKGPLCATAVIIATDDSHFYIPESEIPHSLRWFAEITN